MNRLSVHLSDIVYSMDSAINMPVSHSSAASINPIDSAGYPAESLRALHTSLKAFMAMRAKTNAAVGMHREKHMSAEGKRQMFDYPACVLYGRKRRSEIPAVFN